MAGMQMKILLIVSTFLFLFIDCAKENPIVEKRLVDATSNEQLFYRTNGIKTIELENRYGGIILNQYYLSPVQDSIRIYLTKTTKSVTARNASLLMDSIKCGSTTVNDIVKISISAPSNSETEEYYCSFSVSLPFAMHARISASQGPVFAEELDSTLVIDETQSDVIIERHLGSCEIHNFRNVTAGLIFPDSNFCRIFTETGNITLAVPDSVSCRINMASQNGSVMYSNLNIISPIQDLNSLQGVMGTGKNEIRLESQSGKILLRNNSLNKE
jgi:hypothetical protein